MSDSLKHLEELPAPELVNKDTMLIPQAAADRRGWVPAPELENKAIMLIKRINLNPFLLAQWLRYRLSNDSLLRNSIYIMSSTFATAMIGYLFWIVAAHIYSPHDVGLASALIAVMTLASMLANLGIGPTLVQTLPRRESGHAYSLTLNAGLATGTLASLLAGTIMIVALPSFSQQFAIVGHQAAYGLRGRARCGQDAGAQRGFCGAQAPVDGAARPDGRTGHLLLVSPGSCNCFNRGRTTASTTSGASVLPGYTWHLGAGTLDALLIRGASFHQPRLHDAHVPVASVRRGAALIGGYCLLLYHVDARQSLLHDLASSGSILIR